MVPIVIVEGAHGITVIVIENGHSDPNSKPWKVCLHFTQCLYTWERYASNYSLSPAMGKY